MQQNDRKRTVKQQEDLPGELRGFRNPFGCKSRAQPFLKPLLVRGADLHRGVTGQVGEFG